MKYVIKKTRNAEKYLFQTAPCPAVFTPEKQPYTFHQPFQKRLALL